jgi:hypothetical protein
MRGFLPLLAALSLAPAALAAQGDARLDRLDPALGITVRQLIDSARAAGLPTEPLVDKALEGASKHAPGARISDAVRGLLEDLGRARGALGSGATEPELVAGAAALRAGLPPEGLGALRRARRDAAVTVPLATLADLVARGVPVETAQDAVLKLARRGEPDEDFVELRQEVERDISAGVPPAAAASVRANGGRPPDQVVAPGRGKGKGQQKKLD